MDLLAHCPLAPSVTPGRRGVHTAVITDRKTKQTLIVTSEESFIVHMLDDPAVEWTEGSPRPDAVLITDSWVCFLELKGTVHDGVDGRRRGAHAMGQLEHGAAHFAPVGRTGEAPTHGDTHHDQWAATDDPLAVMPRKDHVVSGVVVTFAGQSRVPSAMTLVAGKPFTRMVIQIAGRRQQARIDLAELRRKVLGP
jgi:hypothetical protein